MNQEKFLIDVAIPGYFLVTDKEAEKLLKYKNLAFKIFRMWNTKTREILIVTSALGVESLLTKYSGLIGVMTRKGDSMQQTAVLGSVYILRKVLSIPV